MSWVGFASTDQGKVAAEIWTSSAVHLLSDVKGMIAPVISSGSVLEGKTVSWLGMSDQALDDGRLVFAASFTDGSFGYYLAE